MMLGETNSQYNEHCLPLVGVRDLSIVTYYAPRLTPPPEIRVFAGDGTIRGFLRALGDAVDHGEYDAIHVHAPPTGALALVGLAARPARRRAWRSLVYTVHDSFHDYPRRDRLVMLPIFAAFRRVVFCGHAARDSYPRLWRAVAGARARVVPNAADLDRVDRATAGARAGRGDWTFEVVSVGRIEPVKDPLVVLDAFRRADDGRSRLAFIGAGSFEPRLDAAIAASGLDGQVERTGLIARDEVFIRCARADLFVSASRGEGLPVAVIEAMASGCPVVVSDIPPHRELADGAACVSFVPPGDVGALARAIERHRALPAPERREIGARCRQLARARFGLASMHAGMDAVYRELG
jgi:glycosyltransferase involved in cell wall biosynthesis